MWEKEDSSLLCLSLYSGVGNREGKAGVEGKTVFVWEEGEKNWPGERFSKHEVYIREILRQKHGLCLAATTQYDIYLLERVVRSYRLIRAYL